MWQMYALLALDIARERQREARQLALARQARASMADERRRHGLAAAPSPVRVAVGGALRRASGAFEAVSNAACAAASRIDGRTA